MWRRQCGGEIQGGDEQGKQKSVYDIDHMRRVAGGL